MTRGSYDRGLRVDMDYVRSLVDLFEGCTLDDFKRRTARDPHLFVDKSQWRRFATSKTDRTNPSLLRLARRWGVPIAALAVGASEADRTWRSEGELIRLLRREADKKNPNTLLWRAGGEELSSVGMRLIRQANLIQAVTRLGTLRGENLFAAAGLAVDLYTWSLCFEFPDRVDLLRDLWPNANRLVAGLPEEDGRTYHLRGRLVRNTPGPGDRDRFGTHPLTPKQLWVNLRVYRHALVEFQTANKLLASDDQDDYAIGEQLRSLAGRSIQGRDKDYATRFLADAWSHWRDTRDVQDDPTSEAHLHICLARFMSVFSMRHPRFQTMRSSEQALREAIHLLNTFHHGEPHHMTAWAMVALVKQGAAIRRPEKDFVVASLKNCPIRYSSIVGDTQEALQLIVASA